MNSKHDVPTFTEIQHDSSSEIFHAQVASNSVRQNVLRKKKSILHNADVLGDGGESTIHGLKQKWSPI